MEALLLDHAYRIVTVNDALAPDECARLITEAEAHGFGDAPVTTARGFVMMPELRNNTRVMLDDAPRAADLWARIAPALPAARPGWRAVGLNERLRYYRYEAGQSFRWHRDGAFVRNPREESHLTLMFYLNDDFLGGETEFDDGPVVTPRRGMALLFTHHVRHQGATVHDGRKYVLRTDVMYRRVG